MTVANSSTAFIVHSPESLIEIVADDSAYAYG